VSLETKSGSGTVLPHGVFQHECGESWLGNYLRCVLKIGAANVEHGNGYSYVYYSNASKVVLCDNFKYIHEVHTFINPPTVPMVTRTTIYNRPILRLARLAMWHLEISRC